MQDRAQVQDDGGEAGETATLPVPLRQQAAIADAMTPRRAAPVAITLHLDHALHERLTLAAAIELRPAQIIVGEALDAFLGSNRALRALANASPAQPRPFKSSGTGGSP